MAEENFKGSEKKVDGKKLAMRARIVQALFLGLFTLGLSMSVGDIVWEYPVTSLSITTTVFGFMGAVVCEIFARKAEKW